MSYSFTNKEANSDWIHPIGSDSPSNNDNYNNDTSNNDQYPEDEELDEWQLDYILKDIENQMSEQSDAIIGMTRQIEDIEGSLAAHHHGRSCSSLSRFTRKISSYVKMDDDEEVKQIKEEDIVDPSSLQDQANDPADLNVKTTKKNKPTIFRILQRKGKRSSDCNNDNEQTTSWANAIAPVDTRLDSTDVASITSSSTRRISNENPAKIVDYALTSSTLASSSPQDLVPPYQSQSSRQSLRLHKIIPSELPVQQDELPPPPSAMGVPTIMKNGGRLGVSFNMESIVSPSKENNDDDDDLIDAKQFKSSTTWEESVSSHHESDEEDGISELGETTTITVATWFVKSRKAKYTLLCLALALVLMIGLVIGQLAQGNNEGSVNQQQQQQGVGNLDEPTEAPQESSNVEATASPTSTDTFIESDTQESESVTTEVTTAPDAETETTVAPTSNSNNDAEDTPKYDYTANTDYLVGVYYYPWHGDNFHNGDGYMRKELVPQHQPTLGEYNDSDPNVIAQHMKWFRQANIGLLVTSWWGPNRVEDTNTKDVIMEHPDVGNLKIAIHYETTGRLGDGIDKISNAKTDIEYFCENYFDHPNYYKIDGRPVIFIYVSRKLEELGTLEEALLTMRSTGSKCGQNLFLIGDSVFASAPDPSVPHVPFWYFDAVTNYDVYGSAGRPEGHVGMERVDEYYNQQAAWRKQALDENCHYIPAVSPGYNDRAVRYENDHPPLSRRITANSDEGSLLHYQLKHAKELADSKVDKMILVNSFNEWHEDTQIEPAVGEPSTLPFNFTKGLEYVGYGELYLDILAAATSKDESEHNIFDSLYGV